MIVDKLLPHFLVHPSERVIGAGKVALSWEYYNNSMNKMEMQVFTSRLPKAVFMRLSTSRRCSLVIPGLRPNPEMLLPTLVLKHEVFSVVFTTTYLILVLLTGAEAMMLPLMLSGFMSDVCIASGEMPWYSWQIAHDTRTELNHGFHLNKWVEDFSEVLVAVPISSVDSTMLVVKLHGASNGLWGILL